MIDDIGAAVFVQVDDDFGVAESGERMTAGDQLLTKRLIVVDLAIEHHPHGTVLIADRLLAALEIDDAEPAHAETDVAADKDAVIVRTAIDDRIAHVVHVLRSDRTAL